MSSFIPPRAERAAALLEPVFAHVARDSEAFVASLCRYVAQPSISAQDIGIAEAARLLADKLLSLGMDTEILPTAGHPVVLARWLRKPGARTVLLYGHYDVQPPEPLEAWTSPPFEPAIRDGRIYARGVGDNKGQHFAQILALESHLRVHGELPCNVILMIDGEEEVGSPNLDAFAREHRDRLRADLVVIADGSLHPSGVPVVQMGVRGLLAFELHANGARRDVHSGNYGGIVPNPIWTLVQLLATMKGPAGEITIEGFGETLVPPTPQERAAAGKLPIDVAAVRAELGIAQFDAPAGRDYFERLMFQPTLTINGLHGGYGGPGMKTVIPCEAFAKCDMRLVAPQSTGCVFDLVTRHVARHAPGVQVVRTNGMEPSKTPITSPYTALIAAAIGLAQGRAPLLYPSLGGSLPNHVFTGTLGLPTFVVPYANADQCNHAPDENLRIACFLAGVRTGAALLAVLGEHGPAVHGQAAVPFGQAAAGPRPTIAAATS